MAVLLLLLKPLLSKAFFAQTFIAHVGFLPILGNKGNWAIGALGQKSTWTKLNLGKVSLGTVHLGQKGPGQKGESGSTLHGLV